MEQISMNNYNENPANYEKNDKFVVDNSPTMGNGKTYDVEIYKSTGKTEVEMDTQEMEAVEME